MKSMRLPEHQRGGVGGMERGAVRRFHLLRERAHRPHHAMPGRWQGDVREPEPGPLGALDDH